MKRYLGFSGSTYYPSGGWEDFIGSFDTPEAAKEAIYESHADWRYSWGHVVDQETGTVVLDTIHLDDNYSKWIASRGRGIEA